MRQRLTFPLPLTRKEPTMQYMTICLQMIQDRPGMYDQLLNNRTLLPTLERYAKDLKDRHEFWMEQLSQTRPGSSPSQIASEAGEIALKELEDSLPPVYPQDEEDRCRSTGQWRSLPVTRGTRKGITPRTHAVRLHPRRSPSPRPGHARRPGRHANQPAGPGKRQPGSPYPPRFRRPGRQRFRPGGCPGAPSASGGRGNARSRTPPEEEYPATAVWPTNACCAGQ